ncbi:MAG: PIN domain-containing protein [Deltaproteobacteria bacterium]|nr:PIN domain-containing protein [Deltaproteobacteria bacterium]
MRVLFDTNVIVDLLLNRTPFAEAATRLVARVEEGRLTGVVCANTITTVHYLVAKVAGAEAARAELRKILGLFEVAPVTRAVVEGAFKQPIRDFEDAVIHESAREASVEAIVTRDLRDFAQADLTIYGPAELLAILSTTTEDSN